MLGASTWFISHTWSYAFADVIDAILTYFEHRPTAEQAAVVLWIDFFCDSQHARLPSWPPPDVEKNSKWFMDNFADLISTIGAVLMIMQPWNSPLTLQRSWCILELGHCARKNCKFDVAFTVEERAQFLKAMRGDASCLLDVISNVNSMKSDCSRPLDRTAILKGIEDSIGYTKLDRMVFEVLDRWQLEALSGQAHACEIQGLEHASWFNSLGRMHYEQGRIKDAEWCFRKAAEAASNDRGPSDVLYLMAQSNVAVTSYALAQDSKTKTRVFTTEKSLKLLEDTVAACRVHLLPQHILLNNSILQLANIYSELGDINAAQDLYHEVLNRMRDSPSELSAIIANLGLALIAQAKNQYKESTIIFDFAYSKLTKIVGADHPVSIICRVRQALCVFEARRAPSLVYRFIFAFKGPCSRLHDALVDTCGLESERDNFDFFDAKNLSLLQPVDDDQREPANIMPGAAGSNGDHILLLSQTSDFLRKDPEYAMLADSFERCSRIFGPQHPQSQSTHAWLQLVEALKRKEHAVGAKRWKRCLFSHPSLSFAVALILIYACIVLPWNLKNADVAIQQWEAAGSSVVVASVMSKPIKIEAALALFQRQNVPRDFAFDGRIVRCGAFIVKARVS